MYGAHTRPIIVRISEGEDSHQHFLLSPLVILIYVPLLRAIDLDTAVFNDCINHIFFKF
jgi:hypothetical protein